MGLIGSIHEWLKQPFQSGQSAWRWVLFVGLLIAIIALWHFVLLHIVEEVRET